MTKEKKMNGRLKNLAVSALACAVIGANAADGAAKCPDVFAAFPTVCAVDREYQIMIPVRSETLMWVEVGKERFYDESNGIMRSATTVHRIAVPAEQLDREKRYTVRWRKIVERKPYFTKTEDERSATFEFRPVDPDATELFVYHLADTHSLVKGPIQAASYWEKQGRPLDLLVMNGDMPNDCGTLENIAAPYQVSGAVTKGKIPVVYARGNHDLRGVLAEKYAELTPSSNGRTYYTWRVGPVWGVSLDCGEDKTDDHPEYGHTICCHAFRVRETRFLRELSARGEREFSAPGVRLKMVLCHIPFSEKRPAQFDIEDDTYREWCKILREDVKPDLMLSGHNHRCYVTFPKGEKDYRGQPCPVVVGSKPDRKLGHYVGAALHWRENEGFEVFFTDDAGKVRESVSIGKQPEEKP
ncbi:MAG: metallophosphoesterase [Victivallaceae bacterium]|nr:metallophosphoesterase [Victivallaceae bacterium]